MKNRNNNAAFFRWSKVKEKTVFVIVVLTALLSLGWQCFSCCALYEHSEEREAWEKNYNSDNNSMTFVVVDKPHIITRSEGEYIFSVIAKRYGVSDSTYYMLKLGDINEYVNKSNGDTITYHGKLDDIFLVNRKSLVPEKPYTDLSASIAWIPVCAIILILILVFMLKDGDIFERSHYREEVKEEDIFGIGFLSWIVISILIIIGWAIWL